MTRGWWSPGTYWLARESRATSKKRRAACSVGSPNEGNRVPSPFVYFCSELSDPEHITQTNKQANTFLDVLGATFFLLLSQTATIQGLIHLRSSVGNLIPSGSSQAFHRAGQHCPVHEEETKEMKRKPPGWSGRGASLALRNLSFMSLTSS